MAGYGYGYFQGGVPIGSNVNLPQTILDKLLFHGKVSEIAGGKLLNKLGTDWLNVSGSAGSETYQIPTSLGAEIIGNNTFDTAGWWSLYEGSISGGVAVFNNSAASRGIYKIGALEVGKHYLITYEIKNYVSGYFNLVDSGAVYGVKRYGNGVYSEIFTPGVANLMCYAGEAGSTFNLDNIYCKEITPYAAYLAADTDYLFYNVDGVTNMVVSTDQLVRYDYARTFIKYANTSPYAISEIAIAKSDSIFTDAELNSIRDYFQLSIWWNDTLSAHGRVKENRIAGRSIGTSIIVNDEFAYHTWWVFGAGYKGSLMLDVKSAIVGGINKTITPNPFVVGYTYRVSFEITKYTSGEIRFIIDWTGIYGSYRSAIGVYTEDVVYTGVGNVPGRIDLRSNIDGFVGNIDHFTIRRIY